MKITTMAACLLLAAAPAFAADPEGTLVAGVGAINPPNGATFSLHYKLRGTSGSWLLPDPHISFSTALLISDKTDFDGREKGRVQITKLKPGDYEIYTFAIINGSLTLSPKKEFSLPFTIKPGEATYIGDFTAVEEKSQGVPFNGYFVLTDQHERDLAIARGKNPALSEVTVAVTDAATLDINWIKAKEVACAADEGSLGKLINASIKADARKKAIAAGQDPDTIPEPKFFSLCDKN